MRRTLSGAKRAVLELPVDLLALEGLGLFLRHADEDDPIADAALLPHFVRDIVFPLFVIELIDRYSLLFRHRLYRVAELLGYLAQHHWRRDWLA
jgi:hypothetical protein